MEFKIINRSNQTWDNMWVGLWTDDDLGTASDDVIGCDTILNLGFTYNGTNFDGVYGTAPPSVGMRFMRGGKQYTGNTNDTIKYYSPFGKNVINKIGYKDEGMSAFNYYNGGSPQPSDPQVNREVYRVLKGMWRLGNNWIDPANGQIIGRK